MVRRGRLWPRTAWLGLLVLLIAGMSASAANLGAPVPVPEPTPEAVRYYQSGCVLWIVNRLWDLAVPLLVLISGLSGRLRNLARRVGRGRIVWTAVAFAVLYVVVTGLIGLPLDYYQGFTRQHAYGLSNQTHLRWLDHWAKGLGVSMALTGLLGGLVYGVIARYPRRWWLPLGLLSLPIGLVGAIIIPVVIDPLFNEFGPMKDRALEREILALADRAGISGGRVFEVDKGRDTKAVNAYVTGLVETKRIVLWDTLLAKLEREEVLFVVGHEMGHYVLGHVFQGIAMTSVLTLCGLFLLQRGHQWAVARWGPRLGIEGQADVAGAPLLLCGFQIVTLALLPIGLAFSRHLEHEADRFALELTHSNRAGALAFVALQQENLSHPRPGVLSQTFRSTHPCLADRIAFCNTYRPWSEGRSGRYERLFRPEPVR